MLLGEDPALELEVSYSWPDYAIGAVRMSSSVNAITATVIIPAYTLERWDLLCAAVASIETQTSPPVELVLCIDRNPDLLSRAEERWGGKTTTQGFPIFIVPNRFEQGKEDDVAHLKAHGSRRRFGAGWARNSAAEIASGDVLAFLDDDAAAEADWLRYLMAPYDDPYTIAVGGPPIPTYETARPSWFPANFDWVFGCAYEGLPKELSPLAHLIGANMSVRRSAFEELGGFHSIDFDDLDLCMRLAARWPEQRVLYQPQAIVRHYVPAQRVSWEYFWRRCYYVNREKVEAFAEMGEAANIRAERAFVRRAVTELAGKDARDVLLHGQQTGLLRLMAMSVGLLMAGLGHVMGHAQLAARRWTRAVP